MPLSPSSLCFHDRLFKCAPLSQDRHLKRDLIKFVSFMFRLKVLAGRDLILKATRRKREHFFIELIKLRRLCVSMDMILSNVLLIEKCTFLRGTDEVPGLLSSSVCEQ